MQVGQQVDVHTTYTGAWSSGFEVAEVVPGGYLLRRQSDGSLLPVVVDAIDVRANSPLRMNAWY